MNFISYNANKYVNKGSFHTTQINTLMKLIFIQCMIYMKEMKLRACSLWMSKML